MNTLQPARKHHKLYDMFCQILNKLIFFFLNIYLLDLVYAMCHWQAYLSTAFCLMNFYSFLTQMIIRAILSNCPAFSHSVPICLFSPPTFLTVKIATGFSWTSQFPQSICFLFQCLVCNRKTKSTQWSCGSSAKCKSLPF